MAHRIRNHGKLCLGNQPILVLTRYFVYDHQARARLALDKAAPDGRPTEQPEHGPVIPIPKSAACTIAPSGARAEPASLVRRCPDLPSFRPLAILQPTLPLFPWTRGPPTANGSASHDPCLSVACLRDGASDTSQDPRAPRPGHPADQSCPGGVGPPDRAGSARSRGRPGIDRDGRRHGLVDAGCERATMITVPSGVLMASESSRSSWVPGLSETSEIQMDTRGDLGVRP